MSKIAYSYVRFSSERQSKGRSIQRQIEMAEAYALKHGLELDTSFRDEAVSAFRGKNIVEGRLGNFLKAVESGKVPKGSTLLVESLDRISREEVRKALPTLLMLINAGITIVSLADDPPQVYSAEKIDQDMGMSLFASMMVLMKAHKESKDKSKRVKDAWDNKRTKAVDTKAGTGLVMTASRPSWLEVKPDKSGFIVITEKAAIIRRMFKMARSNMGAHLIAKTFNEEGVVFVNRNSTSWTAPLVLRILKSESVIGHLVSPRTGERSENYYPTVIDKTLFDLVNADIASRRTQGAGRKGESVSNLFSGLTKCGVCGGRTRFNRRGNNSYLQCLNQYNNAGCDAPMHNYDAIEEEVLFRLGFFENSLVPPATAPELVDPRVAMRLELEEMQKRLDRYFNEFETVSISRAVKIRIELLERQIAELEERMRRYIPTEVHDDERMRAIEFLSELELTGMLGSGPELVAIRLRAQAAIKLLITEIRLLPEMERIYSKDRETGEGRYTYYRQIEVIGPVTKQMLRPTNPWEPEEEHFFYYQKTADGLLLKVTLPDHGMLNSHREKEYDRQVKLAIVKMEQETGIEILDPHERPKPLQRRPNRAKIKRHK